VDQEVRVDRGEPERSVSEATSGDSEVFGAGYDDWLESELLRGWHEARSDVPEPEVQQSGIQRADRAIRRMPEVVGRQLADEANELDEIRRLTRSDSSDDVLRAMQRLASNGGRQEPSILRDVERLTKILAPQASGPALEGASLGPRPDDAVVDGATLHFSAGIHRLGALMRSKSPYPRDVTIQGAGMNSTLLILSSTLSPRSSLRNFTVRDCTVHTGRNYLFDLRGSNGCAVSLDRVRIIGFDMGAGGSCAFGTAATLLYARDSRFEGGFGHSPGSGNVFRVRSSAIAARFDRCHFSRVRLNAVALGAVLLQSCELSEMLSDPHKEPVELAGCQVSLWVAASDGNLREDLRRSLDELVPGWQKQAGL
jgi:hypothetical protein